MTVSMRVMSAGDGYKYLLRTVAAGDGDRSLSTPLTRYYAEQGAPWGRKRTYVLTDERGTRDDSRDPEPHDHADHQPGHRRPEVADGALSPHQRRSRGVGEGCGAAGGRLPRLCRIPRIRGRRGVP